MLKKTLLIASIAVMLLACNLSVGRPSATQQPASATSAGVDTSAPAAAVPNAPAPANDTTGPGGGATVKVSDGVILLTPGAPLPTPDLGLNAASGTSGTDEAQPTAAAPAGPEPTSDVSAVQLPDGLPVYPGALHLTQPATAMGMTTVTFDAPDAQDKVLAFYADKASAAGYQSITGEGPTKDDKGNTSLTLMKGKAMLVIITKPNSDGSTNVTVGWM
jgi:hypothetical protein